MKINYKLTSGKIFRAIFASILIVFAGSVSGSVWYVNKSGSDTLNGKFVAFSSGYDGPKLTINAALTLASAGDSVVVGSGFYNEFVIIDKDIYLVVGNTTISSFTMNGPAAHCYVFGDTLDISSDLNLTQGILKPFFATLKLRLKQGATFSGGSIKSYVEGRFYRSAKKGAGLLSFPVGLAGNYRPSFFTFTDTTSDTVYHWAELHDDSVPVPDVLPSGIRNISKVSYWTFGREGIGASKDYIFFLAYDSVTNDDEVFEPVQLKSLLATSNAGPWINLKGAGSNARIGFQETAVKTDTLGYVILANTSSGYNPLGSILPFADFYNTGTCLGEKFNFTDYSKNMLPAKINKWFWDFGDSLKTNDTSSLQNPSYTFTRYGSFNVKLVVGNDSGMVDSITQAVFVHALPKGIITVTEVCKGGETRFKDLSTVAAPDSIVFASWSFGDGNNSTGRSVKHTYVAPGDSFNVFMVATSSAGCGGSAKAKAYVNRIPKPDYNTSPACFNDSSYFIRVPSGNMPDKNITYTWYFKNKLLATDTMLNYQFDSAKDHDVKLIATSNKGCVDSITKSHRVYGLPIVEFLLDNAIPGNDSLQCLNSNDFTFIKNLSAPQGQLFNATWKWGDGTTGIMTDDNHSYGAVGVYNVKLASITDQGCVDSFDADYVVRGFMTPRIAKIGYCQPDSITFYDSSSSSTSSIAAWAWTLPGGILKSGSSVKGFVNSNGPLSAKLIITNAEGCVDSVTKSFSFTSYPVLSFTVTGSLPFCPGDSIKVQANGGNSVLWLADSDTSRVKMFKSAGNYKVKAINTAACIDTDSFQVVVYNKAVINAYSDTTIIRGKSAMIRATGGVTYLWTPATNLSSVTGTPVKASPIKTTSYTVTGTDANGCIGKDTVTINVQEPLVVRIPNLITPNGDGENDFWVISELKDLDKYDLTITDYTGKIIFESSNYTNNWNATDNSTELPEGIYYYKLKNRSSDQVIKGFIQVIR